MNPKTTYISWIIRILISFLFILSAVAKLYPSPYFAITTFEAKQLVPLGFNQCYGAYFSRILISFEFALGILILFPFYLKKIIIPSTIFLLSIFCIHLSISVFGIMDGPANCGCFGELIPMTPSEALIKNILSIGFLIILYKLIKQDEKKRFFFLIFIYLISLGTLFYVAPNKSCQNIDDKFEQANSIYSQYIKDIDNGQKLLCFFAPGCDHCMATAKQLDSLMLLNPVFPEIYIVFMDEEPEKIPSFFEFAGREFPYEIMDVAKFWKVLGFENDTPGIYYLINGNEINSYQGINEDKFQPDLLLKDIKSVKD